MTDKLKGVATRSYGPFGTGSTGGPWPAAMIAPSPRGSKLGGQTQNRNTAVIKRNGSVKKGKR